MQISNSSTYLSYLTACGAWPFGSQNGSMLVYRWRTSAFSFRWCLDGWKVRAVLGDGLSWREFYENVFWMRMMIKYDMSRLFSTAAQRRQLSYGVIWFRFNSNKLYIDSLQLDEVWTGSSITTYYRPPPSKHLRNPGTGLDFEMDFRCSVY